MHRLPLADQLPYRFHPPRPSPFWVRATQGYRRRLLRGEHRVLAIDVVGLEHLAPLLERRDGVMLTPNHCDRADGLVMLDLADRVGRPFCSMAAYQIFEGNAGLRHRLFPRLGIFPVDREGADRSAFKAAVFPGTPRSVASRPRRAPVDRIAYPVLDRLPRLGVVAQFGHDLGHQPPHQAARVGPGLTGVLLDDRLPRQVVRAAIDQGTR